MYTTCFVIQRFDNGVYDRRYRETFAPAIEKGGAKPVRADEVLGTRPVIEKIEGGLKNATIAFAEISENNANVFLELGYALALNVPIVIVCDREKRDALPFDISHRSVIFYSTQAQSDFELIASSIEENVRVAIQEAMGRRQSPNTDPDLSGEYGGEDLRRKCLLELLDRDLRDPDGAALWSLQRAIVGSSANDRMVALAVSKLVADGMIAKHDAYDQDSHESYISLRLTEHGRNEILRSYATLMRDEKSNLPVLDSLRTVYSDIPF